MKLPHSDMFATVQGEPYTDENGHTFVPVAIPGFLFVQLLRFDWREEFEFERDYD